MINFFNFKKFGNKYLITNDFGNYAFVSSECFDALIHNKPIDEEIKELLVEKKFLFDGSQQRFIDANYLDYRRCKNYLFSSTGLHIFVVTTQCNQNCIYCQANANQNNRALMPMEIAKKAVDIALASPQNSLSFEFQGGEPLINFEIIKFIVEYSQERKKDKEISYSIVSNLTLLNEEIVEFIKKYNINIATSLDGPAIVHDWNRPFGKNSSYDIVIKRIKELQGKGISVGAIQTTTKKSLKYAKETVNLFSELGLCSLFVRPLTPLGQAAKHWETIGYTAQEFGEFYREVINEIIALNKKGIHIRDNFASIIFAKLFYGNALNYMELRSPCGAAFGQMAYYINGDVFTCDEGRMLYEMGSNEFKLGNVNDNSFLDMVKSKKCRTVCVASTLESLPSCCDCVYQPYCGVCPVVNWALYSDIVHKCPSNYKCNMNKTMFNVIFETIKNADDTTLEILKKWC